MCKSRIWHIPYDQSIEFMTKEINYEKLCSDCMKSLEKRELSKKNEMQKKNKRWF